MDCYHLECAFKKHYPELWKTGRSDLNGDGVEESIQDVDRNGSYSGEELWQFFQTYRVLIGGSVKQEISDVIYNCEKKIESSPAMGEMPFVKHLLDIGSFESSKALVRAYKKADLQREAIMKEIARRDDWKIVPYLLNLLGEKWNSIQLVVVGGKSIWNVEDTLFLEPILLALGELRDARAVRTLKIIATQCPDKQLKDVAQKALEKIGASDEALKVVELSKELSGHDFNRQQGIQLLDALRKKKDPTAIPALIEIEKNCQGEGCFDLFPVLEPFKQEVVEYVSRYIEDLQECALQNIPECVGPQRRLERFLTYFSRRKR